jgi:hypothetical protein
MLLLAASPAVALSSKTIWVTFRNPLDAAGISYQVTDDTLSIIKASEEIQGYSQDRTLLGRIGTAFFAIDATKLGVQIALNNSYDIKNLQVANYRSPQVQNNTLKLAILILIEFSSPQVSLGYATADVVLTLSTGRGLDDWTVVAVGQTGTYASRFTASLPSQFAGFKSWIEQNAGEIWKAIPSPPIRGGPCGLIVVPIFAVLLVQSLRERKHNS